MKKVAVVTGGFGSIGYGIVQALDKLGYAVAILSRSADSVENKQKLDQLTTDQKMGIVCDITKSEDINRARIEITSKLGNIDVLVNCSGMMLSIQHGNLDGLTDELFDKLIATNLRGVFTTTKTFVSYMNDDSVIVNISSASAHGRGGSSIAYAAAKSGVDSLTRNFAVLLAPKVRVVSVAPGFVDVPMNNNPARQHAIDNTPMGRVAAVEDVVDTVLFAINSKFVTGNSILVDGGRCI
jgi:3-oxoacyl-[acyl-carrier protein] reductase